MKTNMPEDETMRLIYSPDDGGWYWEDMFFRRSQVFATQQEAEDAKFEGNLEWED